MHPVSQRIPEKLNDLKEAYIGQAMELFQAQQKMEKLEAEVAWDRKQMFGRRSEKSVPDYNQLSLDGIREEEKEATPKKPEKVEYQITVKRAKPGKKSIPKSLPRRRIEHLPEKDSLLCRCGKEMNRFGEDVHEMLNFIPAKMEVIEHVYPKFSCSCCKTGVIKAPAGDRPIEKGRPGPGLLAQVIISKYADHLPLDRQVRIFKRFKIDIAKSTMAHWIKRSYEILEPIYEKMKEQILSSGYVLSDDTGIKVLDKNLKGKSHQGYIWTYGDTKQVVHEYTSSRSREGPATFLKGYKGYLQTDGYPGYNLAGSDGGVIQVGCFAHARRKFYDISELYKDAVPYVRLFDDLFRLERIWKNAPLSPAEIKEKRAAELKPLLDNLKKKLNSDYPCYLPQSPMAKAIKYSINQWDKLYRVLDDGRLQLSNNFSERCVKPVVIGRKNWLFAGSHEGAKRSAMMFSLVESCKLQKIDPWEYFNDVFERITEPVKIENLTPIGWKLSKENQDVLN